MRFPPFVLSFNCLAKSRLCAANASKGESSGGISPATCKRGEGNERSDGDGKPLLPVPIAPYDCDRRSMKLGLLAISPVGG